MHFIFGVEKIGSRHDYLADELVTQHCPTHVFKSTVHWKLNFQFFDVLYMYDWQVLLETKTDVKIAFKYPIYTLKNKLSNHNDSEIYHKNEKQLVQKHGFDLYSKRK